MITLLLVTVLLQVAACTSNPGDKSAPAFEYDPEKAKSQFSEAGASDLELAKVRKSLRKLLVAVQEYWSKVGVTL